MKTLAFLALCLASVAIADDFKTIDGKEYKNATVSRVEPDGIVLITKSGISKVYFTELPKDVQEHFHYDAKKAAEFTSQTTEKIDQLLQQRAERAQQRAGETAKYWSENPTPPTRQEIHGSSLDRPAYGGSAGSITPQFLVSEYAASEIKADSLYRGRVFTVSGVIRSIFRSGDKVTVELYVPYHRAGTVSWMNCVFNDPGGLGQKAAGNPITLTGRVAGMRGNALTMEDCHL